MVDPLCVLMWSLCMSSFYIYTDRSILVGSSAPPPEPVACDDIDISASMHARYMSSLDERSAKQIAAGRSTLRNRQTPVWTYIEHRWHSLSGFCCGCSCDCCACTAGPRICVPEWSSRQVRNASLSAWFLHTQDELRCIYLHDQVYRYADNIKIPGVS